MENHYLFKMSEAEYESNTPIVTVATISPDYSIESNRLKSFVQWPIPHIVEPKKLAAAGFYYMGINDNTTCFECGLELYQWKEDDQPMEEHRKWSQNCVFLNGMKCDNGTCTMPPPRGNDVCGIR